LLLLFPRRLALLVLLKLELTEVHQTAHWRRSVGRDLDQIQLCFLSCFQRSAQGDNSPLTSDCIDKTHFFCNNLLVYSTLLFRSDI
jgi:hypothetical protein